MNKGWRILMFTAIGILAVALFGWITMSLWNWLVPVLFNGPVLTFWQALGLLVLSKILLSGFGGKGRGGMHWKHRYYQKLSSMPPEERERFKQKMMEKWCGWREDTSAKDSSASNV